MAKLIIRHFRLNIFIRAETSSSRRVFWDFSFEIEEANSEVNRIDGRDPDPLPD